MSLKIFKLILLRHGESKWNKENKFTGWTDVSLTHNGREEAKNAGILLMKKLIRFDIIYTSLLKRAIDTMEICLQQMQMNHLPIEYNWKLNERHYGSLQGLNKTETAKKYGEKQVLLWRRSYNISPPKLELNDKRHPRFDLKYNQINTNELPSGECLKDTVRRVLELWKNDIAPKILSGKKILIVAHGNSLRALVKYLDKISDKDIIRLNIPTGIPLVYELDIKLNPINHYYLGNPMEVEKKIRNVKAQGKPN